MPPTFTINPSMIPIVQTRKALLILDMQNDFLSADGVLQIDEPEGFLDRTLDLARGFRDSGAGDVIWVRSEFEGHRSLLYEGDQIITADAILRSQKAKPTRGRQPTSTVHEGAAMEADEEAFLSISTDGDKKPCVRKGTRGAAFAPEVQAAVVAGRDIVVTKSHYSAFASGQQQLVQLLRGRFVTQLYVCGALTNISIYATAFDAGRHGYEMTIIEDCCGFRSTMRHLNAVRQLVQLTGCEVISSDTLLDQIRPPTPPSRATGLSPFISKIGLDLGGGSPDASPAPAAAPPPRPTTKRASPQPDRGERKRLAPPRRAASNDKIETKRPSKDTAPLAVDSELSSPDSESPHSPEKKPEEVQRKARAATVKRSELASSKGPAHAPEASSTKTENPPRIRNRVRQRLPRPSSDKKTAPSPLSPENTLSTAATQESKPEPKAPVPIIPSQPRSEPKLEAPVPASTAQSKLEHESPPNMATKEATAAVCSEPLCEGDTTVITNVLCPDLAANAFERLLDEVSWAGMSHMGGEVPRRIAVQGAIAEDGSMPVYRHPADESPPLLPFSPTVLQIKEEIEKHLGHPLNHVLIQH
jgi:nicotinamidase-related amidase